MAYIRCVAGLGNPGRRYQATRHNLGFMVLDKLTKKYRISFKPGKGDFYSGWWQYTDQEILLVKPTTFMNNSGLAILQARTLAEFLPEELLVICDDVDLPLGTIRLRQSGSDGGHLGLKSIIYHLQSEGFPRLRTGIGRPPEKELVAEYVLDSFLPEEEKIKTEVIEKAVSAVECLVEFDLQSAMNRFNVG